MRSAMRAVCSRCAISIVVRPRADDAHRALHLRLGLRSRLEVASSSSRIAGSTRQRPGQADELALPGRQRAAALAHPLEVAAGQPAMKSWAPTARAARFDLGVGGVGAAVGDVVADRAREEERLLGHEAELVVVGAQVEVASRGRRRRAPRRSRVVEAGDELHHRGLARAGLADQRDGLARRDVEVDAAQRLAPGAGT